MTVSTPPSKVPKQRLVFLDTLRGLSAVSVVLFHMIQLASPPLEPPTILSFFSSGGVGVTMFFIISAYSLCMTMPRHLATGHGCASFYIHRLCRILPLFYVMTVISVWFFISRGVRFDLSQIALNVSCLFNFFPGQQESVVMAGWTIGVEMLFYAVFPLLYATMNTVPRLTLLFGASLAASFVFQNTVTAEVYVRYSIIRHFPVFVWGMLLFTIGQQCQKLSRYRLGASLGLCLFAVVAYRWIGGLPSWHHMNYYLQLLPFSCLFLGLLLFPLPILVSPVTGFLGTISYSTYLLHPLIIAQLTPLYPRLARLDLGLGMTFVLCALATLGLVLPLAYVLFVYVEKPGIWFGRWIMARRFALPVPGLALVAAPERTRQ